MKKQTLLREGKAKKVFNTATEDVLIVEYKDDITAFNNEKRGMLSGKGEINNRMTNHFMRLLEQLEVPTHYMQELSPYETAVKRVTVIPLEVIVRNLAAGSFSSRYGSAEGTLFRNPTLEFCLKNDNLSDPLINDSHIIALKLSTPDELALIREYAFKTNAFLKSMLLERGITLVDMKLEFGRTADGTLVLADEISPDTCRFWDSKSGKKLDKDRFRLDLGDVMEGYKEAADRLL